MHFFLSIGFRCTRIRVYPNPNDTISEKNLLKVRLELVRGSLLYVDYGLNINMFDIDWTVGPISLKDLN